MDKNRWSCQVMVQRKINCNISDPPALAGEQAHRIPVSAQQSWVRWWEQPDGWKVTQSQWGPFVGHSTAHYVFCATCMSLSSTGIHGLLFLLVESVPQLGRKALIPVIWSPQAPSSMAALCLSPPAPGLAGAASQLPQLSGRLQQWALGHLSWQVNVVWRALNLKHLAEQDWEVGGPTPPRAEQPDNRRLCCLGCDCCSCLLMLRKPWQNVLGPGFLSTGKAPLATTVGNQVHFHFSPKERERGLFEANWIE